MIFSEKIILWSHHFRSLFFSGLCECWFLDISSMNKCIMNVPFFQISCMWCDWKLCEDIRSRRRPASYPFSSPMLWNFSVLSQFVFLVPSARYVPSMWTDLFVQPVSILYTSSNEYNNNNCITKVNLLLENLSALVSILVWIVQGLFSVCILHDSIYCDLFKTVELIFNFHNDRWGITMLYINCRVSQFSAQEFCCVGIRLLWCNSIRWWLCFSFNCERQTYNLSLLLSEWWFTIFFNFLSYILMNFLKSVWRLFHLSHISSILFIVIKLLFRSFQWNFHCTE